MRQLQLKQPSLILPGKQIEISKTSLEADYFPARQYELGLAGQQLIDFSGNSNHGTHGSSSGSDGGDPKQENNCLFYDTDDYTNIPLNVFSPLEGAFEVAFKAIDNYGGLRILGSDHSAGNLSKLRTFLGPLGFCLALPNGVISAAVYGRIFFNTPTIYTCTWKYNGCITLINSYVNGDNAGSVGTLGQLISPDIALFLGKWNTSYSRFRLYRALFYCRALSSYEVMVNYKIHQTKLKEYGVIV